MKSKRNVKQSVWRWANALLVLDKIWLKVSSAETKTGAKFVVK